MRHANQQAYIRQLCCLGLGKEIMISELLRAFHAIIPSESNLFVAFDENMAPVRVFSEYVIPEVLDVYVNEQDRIIPPAFRIRIKNWFGMYRVHPDFSTLDEQFFRHDFYQLIMRPYNHYYTMHGKVRCDDYHGSAVILARMQSQAPFGAAEEQQLERLLPYIEHGLRAGSGSGENYVDSGQTGMAILARSGKVVYLDDSARTLLLLAAHGIWSVGDVHLTGQVLIPTALRQMCGNLDLIFRGLDAPPPICSNTNARGRFVFRAHWLRPPIAVASPDAAGYDAVCDALIGVTIEHQEPLRLRLLRNLQGQCLSVREQEVCLALADHLTQPAIAARLGVSLQTVVTYMRRIYEKLEVHNREALLGKLLSSEPNGIKRASSSGTG